MIRDAKEAREIAKGFLMKSGKSELLKDLQEHFTAKGYLTALDGPEVRALVTELERIRDIEYRGNPHPSAGIALLAIRQFREAVKK